MGRAQGGASSGGGAFRPRGAERHLAEAARRAARETFEDFSDDRSSPFFQADGKTPEETWEIIREEVGGASALAAVKGSRKEDIFTADFTDWHRSIFTSTFPTKCGKLRDHEEGYGYVVGSPECPIVKQARGTGWKRVPGRLRAICVEFNQEAARMDPLTAEDGLKLMDATRAAARLYSKFLSIHPFEDGNGRTAYAVLSYALVRVDAIVVELASPDKFHWALGRALQPGGRKAGIEPLAELLAQQIRAARAQDLS